MLFTRHVNDGLRIEIKHLSSSSVQLGARWQPEETAFSTLQLAQEKHVQHGLVDCVAALPYPLNIRKWASGLSGSPHYELWQRILPVLLKSHLPT